MSRRPGSSGAVPAGAATATLALAMLLALAVYFGLEAERLRAVWTTGAFFDTDDAMRMVQVRDLMAGQGWYDMTAWRLDPPAGVFSHWSRVVDAPLVLLIEFFQLFLNGVMAERAARIAFPAFVLLALFGAGAYAARIFAGRSMRLFGVASMLFCGVMFWQFPPGRIDHHAPQITALIFSMAAMAEAFDPARARKAAALSGAIMALCLAIGFENLAFFALVAAAPAILYVLRGAEARDALLGFALGLGGALTFFFLLTVGPARWGVEACDALSMAHLVSALTGCAIYALLAIFGARISSPAARLAAAALAAAITIAPLALMSPACLADPFAGLDPIVRRYWLDHNAEVISIVEDYRIDPTAAVLMAATILIGFLGALFGMWRASGMARARWLFLSALIAIGVAIGSLHVRVLSTTMPLAGLGLLAPVGALRDFIAARMTSALGRTAAPLTALLALFGLSSFGVALAEPPFPISAAIENSAAKAWRRPDPCLESASYEPLAALGPGLAVSQISPGSYLLAQTSLSVLAAPYHRDNHGNRLALDILRSPPALAESLARKAGAKYVLLCWAKPSDEAALREMAPDGLGAELTRGHVPGWLRPLDIKGTPFHAFQVMPRSD
ncbi:hypothetical protein K9U39_14440 [Rhodoblastus acidophilus]|uniref:Uncharacterized protein n=1 Tax=Candidatus Rhodoblastus alkanivorans TaxID=2954117 RepID=A0ABS9ZES5_9HYPH|nr:hypothetical protein [Candidatus Rhodoblastus alkanivorans]MCI4680054.1 hypothetical protein [Candidatus Rhodoblastus alkanivorans]MCI4684802.1 hypothetical protein [Candidatus Rhodoblastus alkanivorans]MDI4642126.1 hypothetical protein [Rhodoblastus acidophilus]